MLKWCAYLQENKIRTVRRKSTPSLSTSWAFNYSVLAALGESAQPFYPSLPLLLQSSCLIFQLFTLSVSPPLQQSPCLPSPPFSVPPPKRAAEINHPSVNVTVSSEGGGGGGGGWRRRRAASEMPLPPLPFCAGELWWRSFCKDEGARRSEMIMEDRDVLYHSPGPKLIRDVIDPKLDTAMIKKCKWVGVLVDRKKSEMFGVLGWKLSAALNHNKHH